MGRRAQLNVGYLRDSNRGNGSKVAGWPATPMLAWLAIADPDCVAMVTPRRANPVPPRAIPTSDSTIGPGVGAATRAVLLSRWGDVWWQRGAKLNPRRPNIKANP